MPLCMMGQDQGGAPESRSERIQVLFEQGLFGTGNLISERLSDLSKATQLENGGKARKHNFDLSNTRTMSCCGWCVFRKPRHVGIQDGGGVMRGGWLQT